MRKSLSFFLLFVVFAPSRATAHPVPWGVASDQPTYRNNPDGVEKLIKDLLAAANAGKTERFESLRLPHPTPWFKNVFGEALGAALGAEYEADRPEHRSVLPEALLRAAAGRSNPDIQVRHDKALVRDPFLLALMGAMSNPVRLYGVVLNAKDETKRFHLGYFVHLDGRFCYVGRLFLIVAGGHRGVLLVRPSIEIQQPEIVDQPRPRYPSEAKGARVQGTVQIEAVVAADGRLNNLRVLSGHPLLTNGTLETVRNWRFKALVVGSKPLETPVVIEIAYTFN